jgi:hypothetical protein
VVGELVAGPVWTFRPERSIGDGGTANPVAIVRQLRGLRRTAAGYLEKRSLPRPQIAWASVQALRKGLTAGRTERRQEPAGGLPPSP